jgi:hypothetical protein
MDITYGNGRGSVTGTVGRDRIGVGAGWNFVGDSSDGSRWSSGGKTCNLI